MNLRQGVAAQHVVERAVVTQEFLGFPPGRVIGQRFRVGEIIAGGLANAAVNEGWAVEERA